MLENRKIYLSGGNSYIITLPKKWVEENGLKAGDYVLMNILKDSIVIKAKGGERVKKTAVIDAENIRGESLIRRIISHYLAGFDSIRVKVYNEEHRRAVALASDILIGAEVIEDLGKEVVLEIFVDNTRFTPDYIVERMSNVCLTMLSDFKTALKDLNGYTCSSITIRENEVDRLHFLVLRQLKSAIRDSSIGILPEDVLEYRTTVRALERIADHCANMAESLMKIGKPLPEFCKLVEMNEEILKMSTVAFFKRNPELADEVIEKVKELYEVEKEYYKLIFDQDAERAVYIKAILDSLSRIAGYCSDIAEVVINMCVLNSFKH